MDKTFEDTVLTAIRKYGDQFKTLTQAANELGVKYVTFRTWYNGEKSPTVESLSPVAKKLGLDFVRMQSEPAKDVCFVNAKLVDSVENMPPPQSEDYIAAPLVGEVGAGQGYFPENEIKSWFLVYRNLPAIRHRSNLIAVEIAKGSVSMQPTLNPGDIVLVDRDDRSVSHPGHIMLVMDPLDCSGMIKRVSVRDETKDIQITFYSDNAAHYPPMVYTLEADFDGDWSKAIVGRVIWAWTDMRWK